MPAGVATSLPMQAAIATSELPHVDDASFAAVAADPGAFYRGPIADDIVRHKLIRLPDAEAARRGMSGVAA